MLPWIEVDYADDDPLKLRRIPRDLLYFSLAIRLQKYDLKSMTWQTTKVQSL